MLNGPGVDWRARLRRLRRITLGVTFVAVLIWAGLTWRSDHHVFAWDRRVSVAFIAILDEGSDTEENRRIVERFLSRSDRRSQNLRAVERWLVEEMSRHTRREDCSELFEFSARGPLQLAEPPPPPPAPDLPFLDRWRQTSAFLGFFEDLSERDDLLLGDYDTYVFIWFYDFWDRDRRKLFESLDSSADRRSRVGVVFAPLSERVSGNTCAVVAHELLHTLGASDKYDAKGSVYPEGFADPDRQPRYPQRHAEIMSLGRPVAPGKEEPILHLGDVRVGEVTAAEVGWTSSTDR